MQPQGQTGNLFVHKCQDANIAHVEFMKIYDQSFNEAFPFERLLQKRAKDKKWFSAGLKKSKQREL